MFQSGSWISERWFFWLFHSLVCVRFTTASCIGGQGNGCWCIIIRLLDHGCCSQGSSKLLLSSIDNEKLLSYNSLKYLLKTSTLIQVMQLGSHLGISTNLSAFFALYFHWYVVLNLFSAIHGKWGSRRASFGWCYSRHAFFYRVRLHYVNRRILQS